MCTLHSQHPRVNKKVHMPMRPLLPLHVLLGTSLDDLTSHINGTQQLAESTAWFITPNSDADMTAARELYAITAGGVVVVGQPGQPSDSISVWAKQLATHLGGDAIEFCKSAAAARMFGDANYAERLTATIQRSQLNQALKRKHAFVFDLVRLVADDKRYQRRQNKLYFAIDDPLTLGILLAHLRGEQPIGMFVAAKDATTSHALVFDFDDHEHRDAGHNDSRPEVDALVAAFMTFVAERYGCCAVRSGSGTGFHVFIVFHDSKPLAELSVIADELLRDFPGKIKLARQRAGAGQKGRGCLDGLVEVMPTGGKTGIAVPCSRASHRVEVKDGVLVASDSTDVAVNCEGEPTKEAAFTALTKRYNRDNYDEWVRVAMLLVDEFGKDDPWAFNMWSAWSKEAAHPDTDAKLREKWKRYIPAKLKGEPGAFWRESGLIKTPGRWVNPGDKAAREICRLELAKPGAIDEAAIVERVAATDCSEVVLAECRSELSARLKADGLRLDTLNAAMSAAKKAMSAAKKATKKRAAAEAARHATSVLDDDIVEFNDMYAYIKEGSRCGILTHMVDTLGESERDVYHIIDSGAKGFLLHEAARREAAEKWLCSPHRRNYNHGFLFDPTDETVTEKRGGTKHPHRFNLWRSWSVEQKLGDWSLMQAHILNVIADGNAEYAEYIMNYIAWCVQNPALPAEVALVMQGREGTGKGVLARSLVRLAGQHAMHITSSDHLVGKFNQHLRDCILLFADEAFYAGDKKNEGVLKGLITEPTLVVEKKGADVIRTDNHLKIVMSTNEEWAIPAGADARRFAVFKVAATHKDDEPYFNALYAQMAGGGHAAMLYDLLRRDIGAFHPRRNVPQTDALREQKHLSEPAHVALMRECLRMGAMPGCKAGNGTEPNWAVTPFFRDALRQRGRFNHVSDMAIGLLIGRLSGKKMRQRVIACGFDVSTGQAEWKRCAVRELPPLAECRQKFDPTEEWDDQADWAFESEQSSAERVF
jgi:hypothetical protein